MGDGWATVEGAFLFVSFERRAAPKPARGLPRRGVRCTRRRGRTLECTRGLMVLGVAALPRRWASASSSLLRPLRHRRDRVLPRPGRPRDDARWRAGEARCAPQCRRCISGATSRASRRCACGSYTIGNLPLATAMTSELHVLVWMALFLVGGAIMLGGQRVDGRLIATILAGFAGVALILRPTIGRDRLWRGWSCCRAWCRPPPIARSLRSAMPAGRSTASFLLLAGRRGGRPFDSICCSICSIPFHSIHSIFPFRLSAIHSIRSIPFDRPSTDRP